MRAVYLVQRITLAIFGLFFGAVSLGLIFVPGTMLSMALAPKAIFFCQLFGAMQLGLAMVALVAARAAKPPRALVGTLAIVLAACVLGPAFSVVVSKAIPAAEFAPLKKWVLIQGAIAVVLIVSILWRRREIARITRS